MPRNTHRAAVFEDAASRADDMHRLIESWIVDLVEQTDEARASEAFQSWLDVQSRFHTYSYRNTLLILLQFPDATRIAGYKKWQNEFDRYVQKGEQAIWIWAPIVTRRCPECGNSPSYHERSDCGYTETSAEAWSKGLVGFKPVPVFDVSQTEGESLPELDTTATGDATSLLPALEEVSTVLDIPVKLVPEAEWSHGQSKGICTWQYGETGGPEVEVIADLPHPDLAVTIIHEYAHALLHVEASPDRSKREIEAEAVASVVGRYFGLDVDGSAFYIAAWSDDAPSEIEERLSRISGTSKTIIDAVEGVLPTRRN